MPIDRICANPDCGAEFQAKPSDVARGWAECCSKSCSAKVRESKHNDNDETALVAEPDFIWPSNQDRADDDELERVCSYLEGVLIDRDLATGRARREVFDGLLNEAFEAVQSADENGFSDAAQHVRELIDSLRSGEIARLVYPGGA